MKIINGHRLYEEQDIEDMLDRLSYASPGQRELIKRAIIHGNYGMDTRALLNVVDDPLEFNIDYLYSLDSDVTEELIGHMERFGYA